MPVASFRTPTAKLTRIALVTNLILQVVIAVTGSVVRVTGSGLGCPTWPNCFPGSLVPVEHPEFEWLQTQIEFGNRLLSGVVGAVALACFVIALLHRPRRQRMTRLAGYVLLGTIGQGVIGGLTVLAGLVWWTVAAHFLVSMALAWLAILLVRAQHESDQHTIPLVPQAIRHLLVSLTVVLAVVLLAGTLVTGAGPHAGDAQVARLDLPVAMLVQLHAAVLYVFLGMLVGLGFAFRAVRGGANIWRSYWILVAVVLTQGALGMAQYLLGVPEILVSLHVLGAALVTVAMANVWAATGDRGTAVAQRDLDSAAHLVGSSESSPASQR